MSENTAIKLELAAQFENEGKDLHALQIYSSLLTDSEYMKTAHLKTAEIYDRMSKPVSAANILKQYLSKKPDDLEIVKLLAEYLIEKSLNEEALEVLSHIPREKNTDIYYLMGLANFNSGEYEIACLNFYEFNRNNLSSPLIYDSYLYLAKAKYYLNQLDEALDNLQRAEKLSALSFDLCLVFARVYYAKKMYFHAGEYLRKAQRLDDHFAGMNILAGQINFYLGNYAEAERYLLESLVSDQPTAEIYTLLGLSCRRLNKPEESEKYFENALRLDPHFSAALKEISR